MATFTKSQDFVEQLCKAKHDFSSHTFKVALSNTSPAAGDAGFVIGSYPAPAAANGYTATGNTLTGVTCVESAGTVTVQANQTVFTATAGGIGPFRYAMLYNDTATSPADAFVGYFDYGSSITLADTETFTVKFNNASPGTIFTLT
jgi:hypothetical protein